MFPASLYPPSVAPGALYPGSGKPNAGVAAPTGLVGLFAGPIFPASIFPPSLFAGTSQAIVADPIVDIDNEVTNWIADALGVEVLPEYIPEGTLDYPVLVYNVVDGDCYYRLDGTPDSLAWLRYQFDAYSNLKADVGQLVERLRMAIQAYRGPMGAATVRNVVLHRPASGFSAPQTGEDNYGMYRRMAEYTFYFDQAPPPPR